MNKEGKGTHTPATFKKRFKEISLLLTSYWPELCLRAYLPARSMRNVVFIQHTKIRKLCYKEGRGTLRGNSPQEEGICTVALAPPYCPGDRLMRHGAWLRQKPTLTTRVSPKSVLWDY